MHDKDTVTGKIVHPVKPSTSCGSFRPAMKPLIVIKQWESLDGYTSATGSYIAHIFPTEIVNTYKMLDHMMYIVCKMDKNNLQLIRNLSARGHSLLIKSKSDFDVDYS